MNSRPKSIKVCMISYLHDLYDDRIYWKESLSLKKNGYDVCCIGITQKPVSKINDHGIKIIGITKPNYNGIIGKVKMLFSSKSIFYDIIKIAEQEKADVYHIHDFQLNKIGPKLKRLKHKPKVIYDVHEPYPITLTTTENTNKYLNSLKRKVLNYWEKKMSKSYDMIITTEDNVANQFKKVLPNKKISVIWNYSNLKPVNIPKKAFDFIYCGSLMKRRGAYEMIRAVILLKERGFDPTILILGNIFDEELRNDIIKLIDTNKLKNNIKILSQVPYNNVSRYYGQSRFSLALFKNIEVNRIIMPIKIFEYISMQLPVICSNFGYMNEITKRYKTGITVNPENIKEIANAMEKLMTDEKLALRLKENCKNAASEFNWNKMENKLLDLYENLF